jgi:sugar lactone lactonase YvrE
MTFDPAGNLWVVNNKNDAQNIVMFDKETQLKIGDQNVAPTSKIKVNLPGIQGLYGLDFDSAGNLWVSTESVGLLCLAAADLGFTGKRLLLPTAKSRDPTPG